MKILFLSPHTDDVELGAGGTLIKFLEEGHSIFWVVFSTANESLPQSLPRYTLKDEFLDVAKSIGLKVSEYKVLDFRVRYLFKHRQEVLEEIVKLKEAISPNLIIGPSLNDYHQDHQIVANEMIRAFKKSASIISYELPWNHIKYNTQLFVRLEKRHIEKKIYILKKYKSQIILKKPYFSEDFIIGWARMRGVQVNTKFAEAFEVIRWLI